MTIAGNTSSPAPGSLLDRCDVAVIGGGVVGCAVARRLTLEGADVVLLEKAPDILDGASKANSAILHTAFDAPPGSLEHALMLRGREEYLAIRDSLNLPVLETGALVVAWTEEEAALLEGILRRAHDNGITDTRLMSAREARAVEPGLADALVAAVHVPGEYLVDPWSAPLAYLLQAIANGARAWTNAAVTGGERDADGWLLHTPRGDVRAGHVVNCAGLYGDVLDRELLGESDFSIHPR
ncbi:MAG TPA: FAD-dependent oxidoreductase, partial [Thermopetrobacter sp.]|nr:FAD-dependent oxidoreductase [Thermopetrobacter sp.]